ncbi:MAG: ShlB/FhaC/HecB family hemolysin secretion/activation protein [Cyanobacteria bacterium J06639_14]
MSRSHCQQDRRIESIDGVALAQGYISAVGILCLLWLSSAGEAQAQTDVLVPDDLPPPQDTVPPQPQTPQETPPLPDLPPADELLGPQEGLRQPPLPTNEATFLIERFEFINNTAFTDEELGALTDEFTGEAKTFADIAAARTAVNQLYINNGYATSGAIVPPQQIIDGVVQMEIVEGSLSEIVVNGTQRLHPGYVSSRIALGTAAPLNVNRLVERLQLLQIDPLIHSISADLRAGTQAGTSRLVVDVVETDSFGVTYTLDNNRSPSVGTVRHQLRITEANLLGLGDSLSIGYTLTSGSDGFDVDYMLPISPHGSTLKLAVNLSDNEVVEDPFDVLEIDSDSDFYELTLRHPLWQTPTEEFALGLTASHQISQTSLGIDDIGPTPLSPGADDEGRTRVSALRFFQEWTQRSPEQVLALRSQFNVGFDFLDATINDNAPDSRFFSWQGQAQWVRVIGPDALLLLRGSTQLAADPLLSLEQLSLGGQSTVRGYRQNLLSTDSGVWGSAEVRLPLWRDRTNDRLLQITPFLDAGYGWNFDAANPDLLVGVGVGLLFRQQDLTARFDWGIPLIDPDTEDRDTLQENGLYFTLQYSFF